MPVSDTYIKYFKCLKDEVIKSYNEQGRKASGLFEQALEVRFTEKKDSISLSLWGAKHGYFVQHGRGAGKFPPPSAIEKWIEDKKSLPPIFKEKKKQFAFLISRKIAREGTKGSDIFTTAFNNFIQNELPKLIEILKETNQKEIKAEIINNLKQKLLIR